MFVIKKIIKDNYKLSIGILLGVFSSQIDRIFMSKFLDIKAFGLYVMVVQFGLALLQLQYPIVRAVLPHVAKNDNSKLGLYKIISFFFILIPSLILFLFTKNILWLWSHNIDIVNHGNMVVKILSMAVLINFFYNFIHVKLVVGNKGSVIMLSQLSVIIVNSIFLMIFAPQLHEVAGAISWFINFTIILTFGVVFLKKRNDINEINC